MRHSIGWLTALVVPVLLLSGPAAAQKKPADKDLEKSNDPKKVRRKPKARDKNRDRGRDKDRGRNDRDKDKRTDKDRGRNDRDRSPRPAPPWRAAPYGDKDRVRNDRDWDRDGNERDDRNKPNDSASPTVPNNGTTYTGPALSPEEREAWMRKIREEEKRKAEAERRANEALAAALHVQFARMLIYNGKQARARSYLEDALKRWPTAPAAQEARKLLDRLVRCHNAALAAKKKEELEKAGRFVQYARKLLDGGEQARARSYLEDVLERWPASPAAKDARKLLAGL
jgi:hypothetical protein